jgi:CubicO group peptidase (beta-lactamase class C family)
MSPTLLLVAVMAASALTTPAAAQDAAGQQLRALIEVLNHADDGAAVESFINAHFSPGMISVFPMADHVGFFRQIFDESAPLELHSIRSNDGGRLTALLKGKGDQWLLLSMGFKDGRIDGLGLDDNADSPDVLDAAPAASGGDWGAGIQKYAADLAGRDSFSGAVLAQFNGNEVCRGVWGEASKRYGVPNAIDTKFNLGSMNKMFTAVCIAQLVDRGKLSFDDPVGKHLPDYPNEAVRETVTLHHLLSHTSGMGSHFTEEFIEGAKDQYRHFTSYLSLFADEPLAFEPGERFAYSNAGFFVLGMIVEAASGESYYDYVRNHICAPAGMINTDCYDMDLPVPNLAMGYTTQRFDEPAVEDQAPWMEPLGGWRENTVMHSIKGGPAGGGFSTVEDLGRFARALMDGTLLNAETRTGDDGSTRSYGYGFGVGTLADGTIYFGHSGGFPGINSHLNMFPGRDAFIAAMSNYDGGASPIATHAGRIMPSK